MIIPSESHYLGGFSSSCWYPGVSPVYPRNHHKQPSHIFAYGPSDCQTLTDAYSAGPPSCPQSSNPLKTHQHPTLTHTAPKCRGTPLPAQLLLLPAEAQTQSLFFKKNDRSTAMAVFTYRQRPMRTSLETELYFVVARGLGAGEVWRG